MKLRLKHAVPMICLMLALSPRPGCAATAVGGVTFEDKARVGETDVVLNGAGVRSMFMIKVYAIGLYLTHRTGEAKQAIALPGPKRIRLVTLREVEAERLLDGLLKGLERNHTGAELAGLTPRLDQFAAALKSVGPLAKGSVVTFDLMPAGATRLGVNGKPVGKDIAGEDFHQALLRIWLGDKPAQDSLKEGLLAASS